MKLNEMIDSRLIDRTEAADRQQAVARLSELLYRQGCVKEAAAFRRAVEAHEAETASELSPTLAIPHATSDLVQRPAVAVARTKKRETVFLIASANPEQHLRTLSALAGALLDGDSPEQFFTE